MKLKGVLLLTLTCLPMLASADGKTMTVKQGAPACMTEDLLSQLVDTLQKNDQAAGEKLLKNGCIILSKDVQVTIMDFKGVGVLVETTGNPKLDMWVLMKDLQQ